MTTRHLLEAAEETILHEIRKTRRADRMRKARDAHEGTAHLTVGQKVADTVAAAMGSWKFIIIQSGLLFLWIVLNVTAYVQKWDPYPFILLNLALSFQAAYAAPFIMMSQNRQQDIDREAAACDYQVNIKAELEIELLHQKLDQLRESEVYALTQAVADLTHLLHETRAELRESRAERDEIARDASGGGGLFKP
ncbi:DUF1003 domain-containing protein [Novosphingobium sp.]|uniref:DUF1003 domain-containing protein n=1 Tax=Novosphingobium sp. TaxID=1874826 RepID=UPI003B51FA3F